MSNDYDEYMKFRIQRDLENYEKRVKDSINIDDDIEVLRERRGYWHDSRSLNSYSLSLLHLNRKDDYFRCAEMAADYGYLQLKIHGDKNPEDKKMSYADMLEGALKTKKGKKIENYANFVRDDPIEEPTGEPSDMVYFEGLILRDVILGRDGNLDLLSTKMERAYKKRRMKNLTMPAMIAISDQNRERSLKAIRAIVQYDIRTYKNQGVVPISYYGICITILARYCGIDFDYNKDFEEKYRKYYRKSLLWENGDSIIIGLNQF